MAFRRELILELGGFDETFAFGGEEEELCRRGHSRPGGLELRYEPGAVVVHRFDPRVRDVLRRARAYGRGHARMASKDRSVRPIIYPFPLLTAVAAAAGWRAGSGRALAAALPAPLALY